MTDRVFLTDVGPRDGLQNQPKHLSPKERLSLIEAIANAGVACVEVGSFVSPKAVPAMAGTDELVALLPGNTDVSYSALIPNMKGYELSQKAGLNSVNMVLYASEGMAKANVNMTVADAERVAADIIERARADGTAVIAAVAVAFACPFDGPTDPGRVREIVAKFVSLGVDQVALADTIGAANPAQVRSLTDELVREHGADSLACHFHDTRAMGVANVYAAWESGVRSFDASIAGLGGCPFAPGASGNVATEDVVMMFEQMGVSTGVDLDALIQASDLAEQLTGTAPGGRSKPWLKPWLARRHA